LRAPERAEPISLFPSPATDVRPLFPTAPSPAVAAAVTGAVLGGSAPPLEAPRTEPARVEPARVERSEPKLDGIKRALAQLEQARTTARDHARDDAIELAIALARNIVGAAHAVDADKLRDVAHEAIVAAGAASHMILRAHPDDLATLHTDATLLDRHVELRADPMLARGDIIVDTDGGRGDGTKGARLDRLERSVRERLGATP
jgi:flagellar biosynthesis/type III secretory pathway protein FliH